MMYNKVVKDCFFQPRHVGELDCSMPRTVCFRGRQTLLIDFYLQCTAQGIINKVCFKTNGNPYVIAALEWVCRLVDGKPLGDKMPFTYHNLVNELDIPVNQCPVAVQVEAVYKEILALMLKKFEGQK